MSVSRRVGALLCALVLIFHLAFVPLRARATLAAGALTAVGFAVTVTAFLNLAGIYPFNPDTGEGVDFSEWTSDALQKLIDLYNVSHASAPLTRQTVKSYALGATIAVANAGWNRLRDFVDWIKAEYAPADNAQAVQVGATRARGQLPLFSFAPSYPELLSGGLELYSTYYSGNWRPHIFGASSDSVRVFRQSSTTGNVVFASSNPNSVYYETNFVSNAWQVSTHTFDNVSTYTKDGKTIYYSRLSGTLRYNAISNFWVDVGATTGDNVWNAYYGSSAVFEGIIADTKEVIVPPASDSDFIGIQVAGLGQGTTVDALEGVIESGVQNREQPTVRQVEVEVQAGTEVDSETGAVTENPVVVTPESVIPTTAELIAPDSFVGMAVNALQTKFPFCLPFDAVRILQAFIVPPQAPVISLTFHDPFTDKDYSVTVDLSPWNEVAAVCRFMWSVLLFVAFSLNVAKMFHIERGTGELFLGNVGSPGS